MEKEYVVFCDESDRTGLKYSDFYGGVAVKGSQIQRIEAELRDLKERLGLKEEIKWKKVNQLYLKPYMPLITKYFDEVRAGNMKIRIMFRENRFEPIGLTSEQRDDAYFKLYYQFIKHAFGFSALGSETEPVRLRLYFDEFPDTKEKSERFKAFLLTLFEHNKDYRGRNLHVSKEDITEVISHDHLILQCLDVVLGCMSFRLNQKHKEKPVGAIRRGKRTLAKEKLYKHILAEIQTIKPNFNIGISTGLPDAARDRWTAPYAHWAFRPRNHRLR